MRLSDSGEFGLIGRIRQICGQPGERVIAGIGDDGALLSTKPGYASILTTDSMVEGVHFDLRYVPLRSLGWKLLAVSLSDVASMGGTPVGCVVSIAIPETWSMENIEALYEGISRCGRDYGCPVVGGDIVKSPGLCYVSCAVLGEVPLGAEIRRSGANEGDLLCVTGQFGGARVGFEALESGSKDSDEFYESINRFLEPTPRLQEIQSILHVFRPTSLIDVSDGLASEIRHICEESNLGCLIHEDKIPIHPEAVKWAGMTGKAPICYAMESGEEYELLFTVDSHEFVSQNMRDLPKRAGAVAVIGLMRKKEDGIQIQSGESRFPMKYQGWDHFRRCPHD
jgi:thiamine-monophosphate kinase